MSGPRPGGLIDAALRRQLEQWKLRIDGDAIGRRGSIVQPVRTADGARAVLKIGGPDEESEHEHLVLRRWAGEGAVRLLSADPPHRALLLERLNSATLHTMPDIDACDIVGGLYRRLHVPAMPRLRSVATELEGWTRELESLPRSAPIPHRLVEQAIGLGRDLSTEPATVVLHGNLHYGTVLAADREAWLAIAPTPRNGDPHYELAPMLWHRWSDVAGDVRETVLRRFFRLLDASGLDEERARGWAVVRVVREAVRDPANLTTYVAVAKAIAE
jgi:streptomycin 6-kinase